MRTNFTSAYFWIEPVDQTFNDLLDLLGQAIAQNTSLSNVDSAELADLADNIRRKPQPVKNGFGELFSKTKNPQVTTLYRIR